MEKLFTFGRHHEQLGQSYAVSYASASEISEPIYSYFYKFCLANQLDALVTHHPDICKEDFIMTGGDDIMIATAYGDIKAEEVLERGVSEVCRAHLKSSINTFKACSCCKCT